VNDLCKWFHIEGLISIKTRVVMLITLLVEEMKWNQGLSFLSEVELMIRRRIRPNIRINSGKMKLPLKRNK
jgi:hypothetical protein